MFFGKGKYPAAKVGGFSKAIPVFGSKISPWGKSPWGKFGKLGI